METLPYRNQLDILSQEMQSFQQAFDDIVQQDQLNINLNVTQTNRKLRKVQESVSHLLALEIEQFQKEYLSIQKLLTDITMLTKNSSQRKQRSVLPFVGSIMSKLFGTATVSDLKRIKQVLMKFEDTESQIIHVVSDSLTILNKTQVQVVTYIGHYFSTLYITYIRHYISALFNLSFMFIHCHKR